MNTFDKNINKKLYNAEMPVSEGMWASIEAQIPLKKEKPKYWLLFLLLGFLIPLALYTTSASKKDQKSTVAENALQVEEDYGSNGQKIEDALPYQTKTRNSNESENYLALADSSDDLNEKYSTKITNQKQSDSSLNSKNTSSQKALEEIDNNGRNNITALSESTKSTTNKYLQHSQTGIRYFGNNLEYQKTKKLTFLANPFQPKTVKDKDNSNNIYKLIEKSRISLSIPSLKSIGSVEALTNLSFLDYDQNRSFELRKKILRSNAASGCPKFEKEYNGLYISAEVALDYNHQNLNNKLVENNNLLAERKRTEKGIMSTSYNLGIGKQFKSGLFIESGINFDRLRTRFKLADEDLVMNSTVITIDTIITPNGPTVVIDTTFQQITGAEVESRNIFNQVNIPLLVGYELTINEKFSLLAKGGIQLNVSSSNSGQLMSDNGPMLYSSDRVSSSIYKTNLGLSYAGGLHLAAHLNSEMSVFSGVNFRYYPSDISLESNTISETFFKYGLSAGVRYQL